MSASFRALPRVGVAVGAPLRGLAAVIAVGLALSANAQAPKVNYYDQAHDYFAERPTGRATVVEMYHLGPCEQHVRERDWTRAMAECNFILKIYPNHPDALLLVAQVCSQWKSGLCLLDETFQRAIEINPMAPGTYVVQGVYLSRTKQYNEAIKSFKQALGLDPNQVNAHYNLALTYLDTNQFELANQHAQRAYQLGAGLPGLRNRLQQSGHWNPADATPSDAGMPADASITATVPPKSDAQ